MRRWLVAYLAAAVVMLALDAIWLGSTLDFYRARIGHLMAEGVRVDAAAAFYVLYIAGVVFLAVRPALALRSARVAAAHGAVLGFMAYMTYDLTNLATLRDFPVSIVLADLAWGTALTTVVALSSYAAAQRFGRS